MKAKKKGKEQRKGEKTDREKERERMRKEGKERGKKKRRKEESGASFRAQSPREDARGYRAQICLCQRSPARVPPCLLNTTVSGDPS